MIEKVIAGGPLALAAAKRLVYEVPGQDPDTAFGWTAELSAELFASDEAQQGSGRGRRSSPLPGSPERDSAPPAEPAGR